MDYPARTIAAGFAYPEGLRWHLDRLWFADQHGERVYVLRTDGVVEHGFTVPGRPSGMGWLPNGDLLVVSMQERRLYRRPAAGSEQQPYAELGDIHRFDSNDMVVDDSGRIDIARVAVPSAPGAKP